MLHNLSTSPSIANRFLADLRHIGTQQNRSGFRSNMERLGEIIAYEISKTLEYVSTPVETPLGVAQVPLPARRIVLATVLRAGLPLHQGLLNYFDQADNAFIAAYRRQHRDGTFDIQLDYVTCPNLDDCVLILSDPMIASGASINLALHELERQGTPHSIHVAAIIGSSAGVETVRNRYPNVHIWIGAVDPELNAKSYIVPGLGDAGDLAFGEK